ncbi:LTA synthase family protein [Luteibacter jiangsuensis]
MDARFIGIGIAMAGGLFFVLMAWILDRHSLGLAWDAYLFSRGFFTGALLLLTLYGVLLSMTARTGLSVLLGLSAVAAIFVANAKKVEYLHTTLVPADYYFVKDIDLSTLGLFRHYVDGPVVAAAGLTLAVAIGLLLRYEPSVFRGRVVGRAVLLCVSAACGFLLVSGGKLSERIYDTQALRISYSPLESELHAGLISSLVCASNADRKALDVVTDPTAVSQVIATERSRFPGAAARRPTPDGQRPDIIVVQSESFFDPAIMEGVSSGDLLPNLHRAQAENRSTTMTVPTFGGGTLRTEFEVLTGIPLEAYPDLQFPYLQISKSRISSLATVLADAGYSTVAIHPNSGAFWNRRVALRSLGFQQFITINDFPATAYRDGFYLSDHSMTTQVIDSLEQAKEPAFIFAISIEAHGPYRHGVVKNETERDALPAPASWSAKAVGEFRTYSYHIRHADAELGRLWDYLKHRNRPFILVFYGDHLPGFEFAYDSAKFRNGMPPYQQSVPWLLLSNARTNAEDVPGHIFSWMLADEILRQAAVDEPPYFRFAGNVGRMLLEGAAPDQMHAGLQSAARMRLSGTFDGFYRSHARAD